MKKLIAVLLIAVLFFCFAACKSKKESEPEDDFDTEDYLSGDVIYSELDEDEKKLFEDQMKEEGAAVEYETDGSTVITYPDGMKVVQHKDGTFTATDSEGKTAVLDTCWPDNEYTKTLPIPDFKFQSVVSDETGLLALLDGAYKTELMNYAESLKAAGFNSVLAEESNADSYVFSAKNPEGLTVTLSYTADEQSIAVTKE